jgi:FkbM family methyltransferase
MSKCGSIVSIDTIRKGWVYFRRLQERWAQYRSLISKIGLRAAIEYGRLAKSDHAICELRPRQTAHALFVRPHSSDVDVFRQIFIESEYACLNELQQTEFILDLGANVGYSAVYFLTHFPNAHVIAVEPDPDNFVLLERNMAPYGERVTTLRAAIWPHPARLAIRTVPYRDGRDWTRQVQENDEGDIEGIDIVTLMRDYSIDRISLLKMDIEGAEAIVFADNYTSWIDKVLAIAIELHDDSVFGNASNIFFSAIKGRHFHVSRSGELTICRRSLRGLAALARRQRLSPVTQSRQKSLNRFGAKAV